jgi:hypothetical protein
MKEWYNVQNIKLLVEHFATFGDIKLDEARKGKIFVLSDQMEEWLGNNETSGITAATSCANSLSATGKTASAIRGLDSKKFRKYSNLIEGDASVATDTLSPMGEISAVAIAHFGSRANYYKQNLFDRNLPSKDINLALRNGAELLRPKKKNERCVFIYEEGIPKVLIELCEAQNQDQGE